MAGGLSIILMVPGIGGGGSAPPAPSYSITDAPASGLPGVESDAFEITFANLTGPVEVTVASDDVGDTIATNPIVGDVGDLVQTFTLTPDATEGTRTLSFTNDSGLTDPDDIEYEVEAETPLTILGGASVLKSWRKADAGTFEDDAGATPAADDGDPIGRWADQSGNNNHYIQATGAAKPALQLAEQNSLPAIRFDGIGTYLQRAIHLTGSSGFFFAVFRIAAHVSNECLWSIGDNGGTARYLSVSYGATATDLFRLTQRNNDTTDQVEGSTVLNTATTYIGIIWTDGTAYKMMVNGVIEVLAVGSGANNGDWAADITSLDVASIGTLGRSTVMNWWDGDIFEMGEGDGTITDQQAIDLDANLNTKWAVY